MTTVDDVTGRIALALADLFRNATPVDMQVLRALVPVDLLDQADAAAGEVRGFLERVTAHGDLADRVDLPSDGHPAWVRLGLLHTLATCCTGKARTSLHAPDARYPEPVHCAAWKPGLVACGDCLHLFRVQPSRRCRCDGCGAATARPDSHGGLHQCLATASLLTYYVQVCESCQHWTPDQKRGTS